MVKFWLIVKGILMGVANIIPGVSGGTMAVSLDIYDDLIFSITNLFKDWRKSLKFLVPVGIGILGGIIFFAYAIEFLLDEYAFPTSLAFIALILGGLPILFKEFNESLRTKNTSISIKHILAFMFFFMLVVGLSFIQDPATTTASIDINVLNLFILFIIGIIASATMVVPGISGSLVLMILGYYYTIINSLTSFFDSLRAFDWNGIVDSLLVLIPFGIGVLIGIFLISKIIEYLFINFPSLTYAGILGLVIASPIAILSNTGAIADFVQKGSILYGVVAILIALTCFYFTFKLSMIEEKNFD